MTINRKKPLSLFNTVFKSFYHPIKDISKVKSSAYFSMIDMHDLTSFSIKANAYSPTSKFADNNTFMGNIICLFGIICDKILRFIECCCCSSYCSTF